MTIVEKLYDLNDRMETANDNCEDMGDLIEEAQSLIEPTAAALENQDTYFATLQAVADNDDIWVGCKIEEAQNLANDKTRRAPARWFGKRVANWEKRLNEGMAETFGKLATLYMMAK